MKFYNKVLYNIKRLVPMAGIAGATMLPMSCSEDTIKEDVIPEPPEIPVVKHNVDIVFSLTDVIEKFSVDTLQKYIDDKTVDTIYLVATEHWNGFTAGNISNFRRKLFQPRMELSPRLRGRGDFDFVLGEASKVPNDSLWYTQQGWTINKDHQR